MITLSQSDYEAIRAMIDQKALIAISPAHLPTNGFIKVVCPDGDTTPEMINHFHFDVCPKANGGFVCTHLAPVTGGPGAIPETSPMHALTYKGKVWGNAHDQVCTYIEAALSVKGGRITNVALVPHAPCGMATVKKLSVWENFELSFLAKEMIRKEFPRTFESVKVMPHINFAGYPEANNPKGPFRTYLLRREPFERMLASQRKPERIARSA